MTIRQLGKTESLFADLTSSGAMLVVNAVTVTGKINTHFIPRIHQLLQLRHPFLSLCLKQVAQQWQWQECASQPECEFIHIDETKLPFMQALSDTMQQQTNIPLEVGGPLWRVSVLLGQQQSGLIISMHHSICDGLSAASLLAEWLLRHEQVAQQTVPEIQALSVRACVHDALALDEYAINDNPFAKPITAAQAGVWLNQTGLKQEQHNKLELLSFSQEQSQRLLAVCRQHQVSLTIALYGAAAEAAIALAKSPAIGVSAGGNANVRPIVEPPVDHQELACYVSMFSFEIEGKEPLDFWQRVQQIKQAYREKVATGLHLVSCNDNWWNAQAPRRADDEMQQVAGRFNCMHLSNLGRLDSMFAELDSINIVPQRYYFTAAQHLVGAIFWLGAQSLGGCLSITVNCVEPMVDEAMRKNFAGLFKSRLLALIE
ncbi:condensation domain-containing protein [Agarivorans litoreus]|uniref:condensation domain-containing protein n=1 Tax=Agarivorans litoreus TaxID=1510455 RepID=UPI001C7CB00C|nr:condensation domain-containing protein [Agarivorans litoreus]